MNPVVYFLWFYHNFYWLSGWRQCYHGVCVCLEGGENDSWLISKSPPDFSIQLCPDQAVILKKRFSLFDQILLTVPAIHMHSDWWKHRIIIVVRRAAIFGQNILEARKTIFAKTKEYCRHLFGCCPLCWKSNRRPYFVNQKRQQSKYCLEGRHSGIRLGVGYAINETFIKLQTHLSDWVNQCSIIDDTLIHIIGVLSTKFRPDFLGFSALSNWSDQQVLAIFSFFTERDIVYQWIIY